jgi:hypothetical protein
VSTASLRVSSFNSDGVDNYIMIIKSLLLKIDWNQSQHTGGLVEHTSFLPYGCLSKV